MNTIFKSKYTSILIIFISLLFLFQGIFKTYAFTDGYEFIWNSAQNDFLTIFIQQGRALSGWIIAQIFPSITHISDYSYMRAFNLCCLFLAVLLMYRILIRNRINKYHSLIIVLVFIASPYSSIIVHWEATSSCIWGLPIALMSGELIFTALLNKELISKKQFYCCLFLGIVFGVINLFIYQPAFTAAIFPAFVHFLTAQKRKFIWQFIGIYFSVFVLYFVVFQLQLSILGIPPNERAGINVDSNKVIWFVKGAFIRSFQYSLIIGSSAIINVVRFASVGLIVFYMYKKNKEQSIANPYAYIAILFMFYILAYLPSFIAIDTWISFRTMSAITMLSSTMLIFALLQLPFKKIINDSIIGIVAIVFVSLAFNNNTTFTGIAVKEYEAVKEVIAENLKQNYPDTIAVIMPEENFLVTQKLIKNVVTDEFGKLSTSVDWGVQTMPLQLIYELTNDKQKARTIKVNFYHRAQLPVDSVFQKNDWILDIEKIYLSDVEKSK